MKELLQKLMEVGRMDALDSREKLEAAAEELGYAKEQVAAFLEDFDGFPIDDDDLESITGGRTSSYLNGTFNDPSLERPPVDAGNSLPLQ